jgi:hypothetical protein
MDAVVLNCVTQFNIVWRVGTFPFLPMSKCRRKTRSDTAAESLSLNNVSTANARCSSDQRCMMTECFKPFYPAMCVSPRHLQRCRHGAKFKSSNCFCPTLYKADYVSSLKGGYKDTGKNKNSCEEFMGYAVAQLVEELRCKPKGHGFDSRLCHFNFSLA